jgi:hypothetical protein
MKAFAPASILIWVIMTLAENVPRTDHEWGDKNHQCLPKYQLKTLLAQYVAIFAGVTDGGVQARKYFIPDFKLYSQSLWWTTGRPDVVQSHIKAHTYVPLSLFQFPSQYILIVRVFCRTAADVASTAGQQLSPFLQYHCRACSGNDQARLSPKLRDHWAGNIWLQHI